MKKVLVITTCLNDMHTDSFLALLQQESVSVSLAFIGETTTSPINIGVYSNLKQAILQEKANFLYFFDEGTLSPNAFFELIAYATTFDSNFVACSVIQAHPRYLIESTGASFYAVRSTLIDQIEQNLAYTTANKLYCTAFVLEHLSFLIDDVASFTPAVFSLRCMAKANRVSVNGKALCEKNCVVPAFIFNFSLANQLRWINDALKIGDGIIYHSVCVVALTNALFLQEKEVDASFLTDATTLIQYAPFIHRIQALQSDAYPFSKIFFTLATMINTGVDYPCVDSSYFHDVVLYNQYFSDNAPLLAQQCLLRFLHCSENIHHFGSYSLTQLLSLFPKELSAIYNFMVSTQTTTILQPEALMACYLPYLSTPERPYVLAILFAVYTVCDFLTDALDVMHLLLTMPDTTNLDYYLNLYLKLARKLSPYELALADFLSKNKHILQHIAQKEYDTALTTLEDCYESALGPIPKNILSARIYWWSGLKSNSIELFVSTLLNTENKEKYPHIEVRMLLKQTGSLELLQTLDQILGGLGGDLL